MKTSIFIVVASIACLPAAIFTEYDNLTLAISLLLLFSSAYRFHKARKEYRQWVKIWKKFHGNGN